MCLSVLEVSYIQCLHQKRLVPRLRCPCSNTVWHYVATIDIAAAVLPAESIPGGSSTPSSSRSSLLIIYTSVFLFSLCQISPRLDHHLHPQPRPRYLLLNRKKSTSKSPETPISKEKEPTQSVYYSSSERKLWRGSGDSYI